MKDCGEQPYQIIPGGDFEGETHIYADQDRPTFDSENPQSRAVLLHTIAGDCETCPQCQDPVKFKPREMGMKVVCNVYGPPPGEEDQHDSPNVWQRTETYHVQPPCYAEAGYPHGPVYSAITKKRRKS